MEGTSGSIVFPEACIWEHSGFFAAVGLYSEDPTCPLFPHLHSHSWNGLAGPTPYVSCRGTVMLDPLALPSLCSNAWNFPGALTFVGLQ